MTCEASGLGRDTMLNTLMNNSEWDGGRGIIWQELVAPCGNTKSHCTGRLDPFSGAPTRLLRYRLHHINSNMPGDS